VAEDKQRTYYYRPVPGSRELVTGSEMDDRALLMIEDKAPGQGPAPLYEYNGEWLGGAVFKSGLSVPPSVFDELAPQQTPLEQAVYFHLFRLSYGENRNWCRVGKRALMHRARVSDRRLNAALDGLVQKGHLKPLHRSTKGTLYRVYLPAEVLGRGEEPGVVFGERIIVEPDEGEVGDPDRAGRATRERPLESPLNEERFAGVTGRKVRGPGVSEMADWFFEKKGKKPQVRDKQLAVTVLTGLLEDGFTREEIFSALEWFVKEQPAEKSLDRLPYFMSQVLKE
jgi:hypothetical protein